MRRLLLPLGLAALLSTPFAAPGADWATDNSAATSKAIRVSEPVAPLSLAAALELALDANLGLSVAHQEVKAQTATILQAEARPNPEFSALMEDTRSATRITTLQLNQPIELGNKRAARIEAAEQGRLAATAELQARRSDVRAAVMRAFFDVLVAQDRTRLAQAATELAQRATDVAGRRVMAGKVSPVEETKARVAEANIRIELSLANSELANARRRLTGNWGNPSPRFERVEGDAESLPPLPTLSDLQARLDHSPSLQLARREVARRNALTEVERSRGMPDLTVSLGARRNEELRLNQAILGLSIPIPAFDRNQGNLQEALSRTDKARDHLSSVEIELATELGRLHDSLQVTYQEIETLRRDILPGAQSAYEASTRGFELGKFDFLDVLDAQRTFFQAKSHYLRSLGEAHRATAEIERILGETPQDATAVK